MIKKDFLPLFIFVILMLSGVTARAQQSPDNVSFGGGYFVQTNMRKDNDLGGHRKHTVNKIMPFASFSYGRFFLRGTDLGITAYQSPLFSLSALATYTGDDYRAYNMSRRRRSIFAGIGMRIIMINLSLLKDLENESDGMILKMSLGKRIQIGDSFMIQLGTGFNLFSSRYTNYYFGVKDDEILSDRPSYQPNKVASVPFVKSMYMYSFTKWLSLSVTIGYQRLPQVIFVSPTVKKRDVMSYGLMIASRI